MDHATDAQRALRGYGVLDTPNEAEFDAIVREAAALSGTPIALVSLLDEHRQWFKARVGLPASETPITISFCTHAVRGEGVFQVEDARQDRAFANNPLVTGEPGIRFYAGVPLRTPDGHRIGTLCVIDNKPHRLLNARQQAGLATLADRVIALLEARKRRRTARAT